jgi:hypothetical protein
MKNRKTLNKYFSTEKSSLKDVTPSRYRLFKVSALSVLFLFKEKPYGYSRKNHR